MSRWLCLMYAIAYIKHIIILNAVDRRLRVPGRIEQIP